MDSWIGTGDYGKNSKHKTSVNHFSHKSLERICHYLEPSELLEFRACSSKIKQYVTRYYGWGLIVINKYLPCLDQLDNDKDDDSVSTAHSANPFSLRLTAIKRRESPVWFPCIKAAVSLVRKDEDMSPFDELLKDLSRSLFQRLRDLQLQKVYPFVKTSSSFQMFLVDRLRQENIEAESSSNPGFGMLDDICEDETVVQVEAELANLQAEESFISEEDKKLLLRIRWYMCDSVFGDINDIMDEEDCRESERRRNFSPEDDITLSLTSSLPQPVELNNKILNIFVQIARTVGLYCKVVKHTLVKQVCPRATLRLHAELLKRFTYSCVGFSKAYKCLEETLNSKFAEVFPEYPSYPKFSFWRMFMRVWVSEVFEFLEPALSDECLDILNRLQVSNLEKNLDPTMAASQAMSKKKKGITTFSPSPAENDLLVAQEHVSSVVDLSIHEVNIHYKSHSKALPGNSPYFRLEDRYIQQSQVFVSENIGVLTEVQDRYSRFIEAESGLMSQIFLNRTYSRYHLKVCTLILREVEQDIHRYILIDEMGPQETMTERSASDEKQIKLLAEILCLSRCPEAKRPYEQQGIDDILCQRTTSISADEYLEVASSMWHSGDPKVRNLVSFYESAMEQLQGSLRKLETLDQSVQASNEENGVPLTLGSCETLYVFDSMITESYLQQLVEEYKSAPVPEESEPRGPLSQISHETGSDEDDDFSNEEEGFSLPGIERTLSRHY